MTTTRIYLRRDSASDWSTHNPILGEGEMGYDVTNKILKVGDNLTRWNDLSEFQGGGGGDSTLTDSYTENTFTNGVLTGQSKYTSNGGTLLETKTFTYTSGNLTQIVVKDGSNVTTLTQTIAYDGDGNVSSITKDYA